MPEEESGGGASSVALPSSPLREDGDLIEHVATLVWVCGVPVHRRYVEAVIRHRDKDEALPLSEGISSHLSPPLPEALMISSSSPSIHVDSEDSSDSPASTPFTTAHSTSEIKALRTQGREVFRRSQRILHAAWVQCLCHTAREMELWTEDAEELTSRPVALVSSAGSPSPAAACQSGGLAVRLEEVTSPPPSRSPSAEGDVSERKGATMPIIDTLALKPSRVEMGSISGIDVGTAGDRTLGPPCKRDRDGASTGLRESATESRRQLAWIEDTAALAVHIAASAGAKTLISTSLPHLIPGCLTASYRRTVSVMEEELATAAVTITIDDETTSSISDEEGVSCSSVNSVEEVANDRLAAEEDDVTIVDCC